MPKLDSKTVQRELDQGRFWPVYWFYGPEKLKARELIKRIKTAAFPEGSGGFGDLNSAVLDGSDLTGMEIVDRARSIPLGGGLQWLLIQEAHQISEVETIEELFGPACVLGELNTICVFVAKDLDGRKKISKTLLEKAAVIPCEEIPEGQREGWIEFLAKRREMRLSPAAMVALRSLDPWSLEIMDQELEKLDLARMGAGESGDADAVLLSGRATRSEDLCQSLLDRRKAASLALLPDVVEAPEEVLPLVGLITWNLRQLAQSMADRQHGTSSRVNPYLAERLNKWGKLWTLPELLEFESRLVDIDFSMKQTPRSALGMWTHLTVDFCD